MNYPVQRIAQWLRHAPLYAYALALVAVLVPPFDTFPLNDDWVYAAMVRWQLDGQFAVHPYASAFAFTQTLWGAFWCLVLGFSYATLRMSTLVLAAVAAWAVSRSARELGADRGAARLAGLVLVCNPLFLNLAYTFMTDVPFTACLAVSAWFHLRLLRRGQTTDALVASLFGAAAFLDRQFGALIPAAFALALAVSWQSARPRLHARAFAAYIAPWLVAAPIAIGLVFAQESEFYPREALLDVRVPSTSSSLAFTVSAALTFGLFLLPMTFAARLRWSRRHAFGFACVLGLLLGMTPLLGPLPLLPNLLRDFGVGPLLLRDAAVFHRGWSPVQAGSVLWRPLTVLAAIGAAFFVTSQMPWRVPRSRTRLRAGQRVFLAALAAALIAAPLLPAHAVYFDRYLMPPLALLLVLAAAARASRGLPGVRSRRAVIAICAVFYAFSLASLQDYLAWNRAKWQAIDILRVVHNVPDTQIDGGYEFNGLYTSETYMTRLLSGEDLGGRGWWVVDDRYAVSFLPRDGYEEIDRVSYGSWLGFATRHILILRRETSEDPSN